MLPSRIKVFVRVRPPIEEDLEHLPEDVSEISDCVTIDSRRQIVTLHPESTLLSEVKYFSFDTIFPPVVGQKEVFETIAQPNLSDVLNGINSCIIVYGMTGSGKTHSLFSSNFSNNRFDFSKEDDVGIIPRLVGALFDNFRGNMESTEIKISFCQIYCDVIYDLFNPKNKNLAIRENKSGVFVEGITEKIVKSKRKVLGYIEKGSRNRIVANTSMNINSSRSHVVMLLKIKQKRETETVYSQLTLVDLAGSEKLKKTMSSGLRLRECKYINKSLSALGNCVNALISEKKTHIPFRDSKLTRLLTECLNGNSSCSILTCISTPMIHYDETLSTLLFALRAQRVVVRPKQNLEENEGYYEERIRKIEGEKEELLKRNMHLEKENAELKKMLNEKKGKEREMFDIVTSYEAMLMQQKNLKRGEGGEVDEGIFNKLVDVFSESKNFKRRFLEKMFNSRELSAKDELLESMEKKRIDVTNGDIEEISKLIEKEAEIDKEMEKSGISTRLSNIPLDRESILNPVEESALNQSIRNDEDDQYFMLDETSSEEDEDELAFGDEYKVKVIEMTPIRQKRPTENTDNEIDVITPIRTDGNSSLEIDSPNFEIMEEEVNGKIKIGFDDDGEIQNYEKKIREAIGDIQMSPVVQVVKKPKKSEKKAEKKEEIPEENDGLDDLEMEKQNRMKTNEEMQEYYEMSKQYKRYKDEISQKENELNLTDQEIMKMTRKLDNLNLDDSDVALTPEQRNKKKRSNMSVMKLEKQLQELQDVSRRIVEEDEELKNVEEKLNQTMEKLVGSKLIKDWREES